MKILFLKLIDRYVGRMLVWLFSLGRSHPVSVPEHISRLLIIRPGGIGDAVLLVPALKALRRKFPGATIDILAEKRNASTFALVPEVNGVCLYDRLASFLKVLGSKYDVVIDTEQWHYLSAVVARFVRAGVRVGFDSNERRRLFNVTMSYSHQTYEAESFLRLVESIGCDGDISVPFLAVPAADRQLADDLLAELGGRQYVVLFPGASVPERQWGGYRFAELAQRLAGDGLAVVVVGGAEDCRAGNVITAHLPAGLDLTGRCSLAVSAAVIAGACLLVSGDSGILHVGVGLDVPTVSFFGPGIADKWAPRGERHIVINKELKCSPCTSFGYTPKCPYKIECMSEITVDEVYDAVSDLLNRKAIQE